MPNYVTNIISIQGSTEEKAKLYEQIAFDGHPGTFDFNKVIPMPESMDLTEGTIKDDAINAYLSAANPGNRSEFAPDEKISMDDLATIYTYARKTIRFKLPDTRLSDESIRELTKKHGMASPKTLISLGKQYLNNVAEHGQATWYDWRVAAWGTKWNNEPDDRVVNEKDGIISFLSAWSAPRAIVNELSRQYPSLELSISWADEDLGHNVGRASYQNGQLVDEFIPEPGSLEALQMACEIQELPLEEVLEDYFPDLSEAMSKARERAHEKQESLEGKPLNPKAQDPDR